jgi:SsrA-binding protein
MGNKEEKTGTRRVITVNRKARHEYFIEDTHTTGMVLAGTEVKSLRAGKVNLSDAYARFDKAGELWLYQMHVSPHAEGNRANVDPVRPRKLLMTRQQMDRLQAHLEQKGLALVPLSLFFDKGYAKLELGVGRGKKLYDKREAIAERDRNREAQRALGSRE